MSDTFRAPPEEDAGEIARLTSEHWPEPVDEAAVLRDWTFPGVQLEQDARLDRGSYALVESFGDERVWIGLAGRPTAVLLDWAERRVLATAEGDPAGFAICHPHPVDAELDWCGFSEFAGFRVDVGSVARFSSTRSRGSGATA
jgi:hypothetical protein